MTQSRPSSVHDHPAFFVSSNCRVCHYFCLLSLCQGRLHVCYSRPLLKEFQASDVELNVDDTLFTLHINPYFLRLNFSHALLEDDNSSATYDGGTGYLTVVLTKQTRGQEFRDLDLLAKLLAPRPSSNEVKIEVLDSSPEGDDDLVAKTQALSIEPDVLEGFPLPFNFMGRY